MASFNSRQIKSTSMTEPPSLPETRDEESASAWWNPWHWPAGMWALAIGLIVAAVPFGIRLVMLAGVPAMPEPFDVDEFVRWDVPAEHDAFTEYRRAEELRTQLAADLLARAVKEPENSSDVIQKGWAEADEQLKQWLEMHREALIVWRQGTEKQRGLLQSPSHVNIESTLEAVQGLRAFGRLAVYEEARLIAAGQLDEARQWAHAAYRCGGHVSHRGCVIQGQVAVALHAMSTGGLARWAEQPAVTGEQLMAALAATKSDYRLYESRSNILKSEYLAFRHLLLLTGMMGSGDPEETAPSAIVAVTKMGFWVVGEPELTLRVDRQILANQIREIDKPVAARRPVAGAGVALLFDSDPAVPLLSGQLDVGGIDRGIQRAFMIRARLPVLIQVDRALLRQDARQLVFEVLLAAQAHRRDHGEFPENLAQLVPRFLPSVPLDPFDPAAGPLRYRRDDALKAVVWSVGDDGIDGGGNVVAPENARPTDVGMELK